MVDRGLWFKEWKQNQVVLLVIFAFLMLINPLSIMSDYFSYQGCLKDNMLESCTYIINYSSGGLMQINWAAGIVLAISQIGIERSKGTLDFTLSLPYKKSQIFNAKFFMGAAVLTVSQLLGYLFSELLILLLKPDSVMFFHHYVVGMMIVTFMTYALVMAAGALTGNVFAQLLTAFTVAILPFLIITLPAINIEIIFGRSILYRLDQVLTFEVFGYFIPIVYGGTDWIIDSKYILLIPAAMSIIFYLIGYFSFSKHPSERNGSFFLLKAFDRPVQILVIAFGILGFGYFGYSAGQSIVGYIIGMMIGAVVGFLISYFSIYKKTKHQ
ncbi:ABC transporter permease [Bacillus atrophaeus]|uniref:ABC transporter permease n=1 Tax=Bacillus atrophaeus TaxID=1452 RepID=UPI000D0502BD|nr:ABC transporter permease [Bacillus atrophaeus]PSA93557.1 ABC transporter permease [Bacillus atrophaeus]